MPANITKGRGRKTHGELLNHLSVAHGSVRELETHVMLAKRLRFLDGEQEQAVLDRTADVGRLINGLENTLRH